MISLLLDDRTLIGEEVRRITTLRLVAKEAPHTGVVVLSLFSLSKIQSPWSVKFTSVNVNVFHSPSRVSCRCPHADINSRNMIKSEQKSYVKNEQRWNGLNGFSRSLQTGVCEMEGWQEKWKSSRSILFIYSWENVSQHDGMTRHEMAWHQMLHQQKKSEWLTKGKGALLISCLSWFEYHFRLSSSALSITESWHRSPLPFSSSYLYDLFIQERYFITWHLSLTYTLNSILLSECVRQKEANTHIDDGNEKEEETDSASSCHKVFGPRRWWYRALIPQWIWRNPIVSFLSCQHIKKFESRKRQIFSSHFSGQREKGISRWFFVSGDVR